MYKRQVVGYGATCDAYHITSPAENGEGAAKAMELAIKESGMNTKDVDYINAHGTSTHHNDLFETRAIKLALGDDAYNVKVKDVYKRQVLVLMLAGSGIFYMWLKKKGSELFAKL